MRGLDKYFYQRCSDLGKFPGWEPARESPHCKLWQRRNPASDSRVLDLNTARDVFFARKLWPPSRTGILLLPGGPVNKWTYETENPPTTSQFGLRGAGTDWLIDYIIDCPSRPIGSYAAFDYKYKRSRPYVSNLTLTHENAPAVTGLFRTPTASCSDLLY